jgi:organic radical activating enzyme
LKKRYHVDEKIIINKNYVDSAIDFLKGDGVLIISGGEPMLHPKMCQYICDKCRENNVISVLYSNGFWGDDSDLIDRVKNEIKPDYLGLSIDKVHNAQIPVNTVYNIVDEFMDENIQTKVYFNHVVQAGFHSKLPTKYSEIFCQPIEMFQTIPDSKVCTRLGYELLPNGMVEAFCEKKKHHPCYVGKLSLSMKEIIKKYPQPVQCIFHKEKKTVKTVLSYFFRRTFILYTLLLISHLIVKRRGNSKIS